MSDQTAWSRSRPASDGVWHRIRVIGGYIALAAVVITLTLFLKHRHQKDTEQDWKCATAIIEDVRSKVIEQVDNSRGGATLYEVSILAKYVSDGAEHKQWVTIEQPPVSLAEAELQTSRWKGQHCVVRWKAAEPNELIAEVD